MVLAMRHGVLPRTLHVDEPSPHVDWAAGAVELLTEARAVAARRGRPRRAGVSSFGISGTNAHVILEEARRRRTPRRRAGTVPPAVGCCRPAGPAGARRGRRRRAACCLAATRSAAPGTSASRPRRRRAGTRWLAVPAHRAAGAPPAVVSAVDRPSVLAGLAASAPAATPVARYAAGGKLAFLFTGQGAQRAGHGPRAVRGVPGVRARRSTRSARTRWTSTAVADVVFGADGLLTGPAYAQPALFAVEVALFRLLESWGVRPDFLVGHSIGEIAAAHVAGVLSLADACAAGRRARPADAGAAGRRRDGRGRRPTEDEVLPLLDGPGGHRGGQRADVAWWSPATQDAVVAVAERWRAQGRKTKRLTVSPRVPLAADGADAGRVPRGRREA